MFRNLLSGLVETAFSAVGDIAEQVQYEHKPSKPDYDPETGKKLPALGGAIEVVRAVFQPLSRSKSGGYDDVARREAAGRLEVLIPSADFKVNPPATNDRLLRNNESYVVRGVETDPASAMWTLEIEREAGSVRT